MRQVESLKKRVPLAKQPEPDFAAVVGHVVRAKRKHLGIALADMAKHVGLSSSGWSRVETGDTVMTISQLRRVAACIGTPAHEIVRLAESFIAATDEASKRDPALRPILEGLR